MFGEEATKSAEASVGDSMTADLSSSLFSSHLYGDIVEAVVCCWACCSETASAFRESGVSGVEETTSEGQQRGQE